MRVLDAVSLRIRSLLRRRRVEQEMDAELRFHLEREAAEQIARGASPDEARRAALRATGNIAFIKDECRASLGVRLLDDVSQDLRHAVRGLRKTPGFTAVAVLTLALGIGANTAIFTLASAVVFRPLPVAAPEQLVLFTDSVSEGTRTSGDTPPDGKWDEFSTDAYRFLAARPLPFESIAAVRSGESTVSAHIGADAAQQTVRAQAHLVSGNYFRTIGAGATIGRTLTPADDAAGAAPVAVVSDAFWRQQLQADPSAVGRSLLVNKTAFTIVGVAPNQFFGERVRRAPDLWVPLVFQPEVELRPSYLTSPGTYWLNLIGRLSAGVSRPQAEHAVNTELRQFLVSQAGAAITDEEQTSIAHTYVQLADGARGISALRQQYEWPLRVLLGVVGIVLLISCANIGNLLLARATSRRGEMAVRLALGASRSRLVRQLATEGALLAGAGAIAGVLIANWAAEIVLATVVSSTSPLRTRFDGPVLVATVLITVVAAVLFAVAPARDAWRTDIAPLVGTAERLAGPRRRLDGTRTLVIVQIAASLILLIGANLFVRTLLALQEQSFGFDYSHVLVTRLNARLAGYQPADAIADYDRLYDRLRTLPGVRNATFARYDPFSGTSSQSSGRIEGYTPGPNERLSIEWVPVGPDYPRTLGMTLLAGRAIDASDVAGRDKVAMVNDAFVRRYFPSTNPLGRHFGVSGGGPDDPVNIEIVGVVKNAQFHGARDTMTPIVFTAMLQEQSQFALDCELDVRVDDHALNMSREIRAAIADVDPAMPVNDPRQLGDYIAQSLGSDRLAARMITAFSALALVLAAVGLYGVVAQTVARRTREVAVRIALGAKPGDVVMMLFRYTSSLVIAGIVVGLPLAFVAARLLRHQLFGVGGVDAVAAAMSIGTMLLVGAIAVIAPARRIVAVDPMIALRCE